MGATITVSEDCAKIIKWQILPTVVSMKTFQKTIVATAENQMKIFSWNKADKLQYALIKKQILWVGMLLNCVRK